MADFWRYLGIALALAVIALTLRSADKPFGAVFSLAAGAALLVGLIRPLSGAAQAIGGIASRAGLDHDDLETVLKLLGVGFAVEFGAQACRDAGEEGIALRVELGGKLLLLTLSAPLLERMAAMILELTA
ncbi:MAG: hypothetical protein IJS53_01615 [Clostridia bacterium]|nr:hypothetical protein [Clostridia bacterium]